MRRIRACGIDALKLRARLFLFALQIEPQELDFTIAVQLALPAPLRFETLRRVADFSMENAAALLLPRIVHDALQDREIGAHRVPPARPRLLHGDGPLDLFRRWVRQFYPPPPPTAAPDRVRESPARREIP